MSSAVLMKTGIVKTQRGITPRSNPASSVTRSMSLRLFMRKVISIASAKPLAVPSTRAVGRRERTEPHRSQSGLIYHHDAPK
jgi:hypothetical protein